MSKIQLFDRNAPDLVASLNVDSGQDTRRGVNYRATPLLENAVNTALALGRPLLVSGEPGCGKTELGFAIARKLGIDRVRFFPVKSDSDAQRLFYEYDSLRRFHAAQLSSRASADASAADPRNFIEYRALGRAILDAYEREKVAHLTASGHNFPAAPTRSVVVIDEIDKAPRDFPNDLLNEIDQLWFRVPELAGSVASPEIPRDAIPADLRPIIVITSNLERQLPDAFLRRCVFHHIEHPDEKTLELITVNHLQRMALKLADSEIRKAIALMDWARQQRFDKPPGLAELLEFVRAIGIRAENFSDPGFRERALASLSALGKTTRDIETLRNHLEGSTDTLDKQ
jgi:MoxR-like ATPase